jgi:hypothetical protein
MARNRQHYDHDARPTGRKGALAEAQERPAPGRGRPAPADQQVAAWTELFTEFEFLTVASYSRSDGSRQYRAVGLDHGGRRREVADAVDALEMRDQLLGRRTSKVCTRCWEAKPLAAFSRNRTASDGRNYRCRVCEAQRVAAAARKRKERARQRVQAEQELQQVG